jgi:hypothetical protein
VFGVEPVTCEHADAVGERSCARAVYANVICPALRYDDVLAVRDAVTRNRCAAAGCDGATRENWFCVTCRALHCGRYHRSHAQAHVNAHPSHCIAGGLTEMCALSV